MSFVIKSNNKVLKIYSNRINYISLRNDFFNLVVNDKKTSDFILSIDDDTYFFGNLFKLIAEIKYVGKLFFFYRIAPFSDTFLSSIKELSSIDSSKKTSAYQKVENLIMLANNEHLSFAVFYGCVEGHNIDDLIISLFHKYSTHLFIAKQKYIDEKILKRVSVMQLLQLHPYRWLVVIFGGIVMFLTLLLGITFAYYNNIVATVILFITSSVSLIGLSIGNHDSFKKNDDMQHTTKEDAMCVFFDIVSIGSGFGLYSLIYMLIKKEEIYVPLIQIVGLSLVGISVYLSSFLLLVVFLNRKYKKHLL